MKPYFTSILAYILLLFSQASYPQSIDKKQITCKRISESIAIDGKLDESAYQSAEVAKEFVQLMPYNGKPSFQPSEVKVLYDDNAVYFGAILYDHPDSIQSYVTTRDNIGASDYFVVFIDPHNEGLNAYEFLVTPANSQTDLKATKQGGNDNEDSSWDAVWQSATSLHDNGWTVEIRVPYSALRFPNKDEQVWGINFFRRIRRFNSNNSWNFINYSISGFIQQSGELLGIKNIKPPVRLSVSPYAAVYFEKQDEAEGLKPLFKGGMDLKYGLSNSHTLDLMLIPDFGQIQSDDHQLNLSPYELYYSEKRQFFIEGAELFNRVGIFYSRRIGRKPIFSDISDDQLRANEKITYNPSETQLVNATKISGRDKNGWGIGFLNAMSLPSFAELTDTLSKQSREISTQPFTNYNVSVVEKTMKNNSYISLINTNLSMLGNPYRANVTGTEFQLKNKAQTYQLTGGAALSYRSSAEQKTGFGYSLGIQKVKGKFRFNANHSLKTDSFDPNDMGYLQRNNLVENDLELSYHIFEPFGIFKNWNIETSWENNRLFSPSHLISHEIDLWTDATFRNNWWIGCYLGRNLGTFDFDEPRVKNRYYKGPAWNSFEFDANTDQDKKISFFGNFGFYDSNIPGTYGYWSNLNVWWKATQKFNFSYSLSTNQDRDGKGYIDDQGADSVFFGNFDRHTLVNLIEMVYSFNTKLKIDFRCRHYWSWADYDEYFLLNTDGSLSPYNWSGNADVNFNAFNIDMGFRWQFAPNSEFSLVWKNSVYNDNELMNLDYSTNLSNLFKTTQANSLSLRILYYVDYQSFRKKK